MNFLNDWIPEHLLQILGWTLVHSLWQWMVISIVLWLGLRIFHNKTPQFKYLLALGTLSSGLVLALITLFYQGSIHSPSLSPSEAQSVGWVLLSEPAQSITFLQSTLIWVESQLPFLVNIWFFGAVLFLFRLFANLSAVRNLRQGSMPNANLELTNKLNQVAARLGINNKVELKITTDGLSPMAVGVLKPMVLFPAGLLFQMSPEQLEAILAHELAHIKRHDYLFNLMQSTLEILFFYHPCFWWTNQTVKELRENATDDLAIKAGVEPKVLAQALAEVLNFAQENSPELALAASKKRNPTLHRIKRMLGLPAQNYPQNPIISIPMLLSLVLAVGIFAHAESSNSNEFENQTPLVSLENPELEFVTLASKNPSIVRVDTTVKKERKVIIRDGDSAQEWTDDQGNHVVIRQRGNGNTFRYELKGDTLIVDGDTIVKGKKSMVFIDGVPHPDFDFDAMPEFDSLMMGMPTPPVPPFPADVPFEFFGDAEVFMLEPGQPMIFEFDGEGPGLFFFGDTTEMSPKERENWMKEKEERMQVWAERMEERAQRFQERWEENAEEREARMKAWEKEIEPKLKEFEKKMKAWQEAQEPKMQEFRMKMKEWEKTQEPKIEEFQRKFEAWQRENEQKMQEFQRELELEMEKLRQKQKDKN